MPHALEDLKALWQSLTESERARLHNLFTSDEFLDFVARQEQPEEKFYGASA